MTGQKERLNKIIDSIRQLIELERELDPISALEDVDPRVAKKRELMLAIIIGLAQIKENIVDGHNEE